MPQPGIMRTFLFSDLRDFTVFVETRGDSATADLLKAYRRIVRAEVATHAGAEIKTEGDSFYVVFRTAGDAVRCSVGIVRRIRRHNETHTDGPILVGIGINTGEAVEHDRGFVGSAVIIASRLASQATALQILISATVHEMVRTAAIAPMRDLGAWRLKNITEPIRVFEVESAERRDAEEAIGPTLRLPAMLAPPLGAAQGLVVCPDLVQRDAELADLREHLTAAATGETRFVAVTGEGGIGKTRLCRELARLASDDGFTVLGGRSHASVARPYESFVAALRPYAHARGTDVLRRLLGPLLVELRRMLPELDVPGPVEGSVPDEERRDRFLRTIQLLIEDAASQRPVLLVLDDFHEADPASGDLLRYLSATLHGGVCLVLAYRDQDIGPDHPLFGIVSELDREHRIARFRLSPLDPAGVEQMTRALVPQRTTAELLRAVVERSDGIPFYIEELLKTAVDDPDRRADQLALPRTVRDSVLLRVARLAHDRGQPAVALLEATAVAAVPLSREALVSLSARDSQTAAADLAAAVEAQLLERLPTQNEIYQFRHSLTREVIASAIPVPRRQQLHLRVAEALERLGPDPERAGTLARHFAAAGNTKKAVRYAREGAAVAASVGAYAAAIELLQQANALAERSADAVDILEELGAALEAAGRAAEAKDALVRARERTTDARRGARLDLRLAAVLRMLGERAEAVGAVQRAIAALERDRGPLVAEAKAREADLAWAENDLPETARLARAALESARRSGATTVEVDALTLLGAASVRLGRDDGLALLDDAVRQARALGLGPETVTAGFELARALLFRGRNDDALAAVKDALALARERGFEFAQARLLALGTTIGVNLGQYVEARAFAEQAVALSRPNTIAASGARISLAHVMSDQGEGEAALELLESVQAEAERNEPDRRVTYWGYRAQVLLGLGRLDEAAVAAARAVDLTERTPGLGMTGFLNAAEVAEARLDMPGLAELSRRFEAYFAGRDTAPIRLARSEIEAISLLLGGGDAGPRFDALVASYEAVGARVRASYRRATAASARLREPGQRTAAQRELAAQRASLERYGARRYVAMLDRRLDRRVARPPRPTGPLSPREQRVAALIALGRTDVRIAHDLGVSVPTATTLVRSVLARLGVTTRSQVAAWIADRPTARRGAGSAGSVP